MPISTRRSSCGRIWRRPLRAGRAPMSRPRNSTTALADLNTALAINPNVPNAFFWRGQVYRRKGDADHAIEDFSRAIAQASAGRRAAYFARGQLFSAKGDYARAIADFDKLLSLMPDNKEVQQQRQQAIAMQAELAKERNKSSGDRRALPASTWHVPAAPASAGRPDSTQATATVQVRAISPAPFPVSTKCSPAIRTTRPRFACARWPIRGSSRLAEAREDLDELVKLKPNDAPLLALRGYDGRSGLQAARPGHGRRQPRARARSEQCRRLSRARHHQGWDRQGAGRAGRLRPLDRASIRKTALAFTERGLAYTSR